MTTNVGRVSIEVETKATRKTCKAERIRKIGKKVLHITTMDAEPVFKSKEWPYY